MFLHMTRLRVSLIIYHFDLKFSNFLSLPTSTCLPSCITIGCDASSDFSVNWFKVNPDDLILL